MVKDNPRYVWWQGQSMPDSHACIPVTNRGFLYGEGLFRTLKLQDNCVENFLAHHLRLLHDCAKLKLEVPEIKPEWIKILVSDNRAQKGTWRLKWIVPCTEGHKTALLMTLDPYIQEFQPCRLCIYPHPLWSPTAPYKTLSFLDHLVILRYAQENDYDDALTTSMDGYLTELSMGNIFWREGDDFYFPDPSLPFMEGTTVTLLKKLCTSQGWKTHSVKIRFDEIPRQVQIYLCNSMRGIVPVSSIEDKIFTLNLEYTQFLNRLLRDFGAPFHLKLE